MPEARKAFIDIANRNRRRRKQAEEGAGVLLLGLLEKVAAVMASQAALNNQENKQDQINQEFVEVINATTAQLRIILEEQSRRRRLSIKPSKN